MSAHHLRSIVHALPDDTDGDIVAHGDSASVLVAQGSRLIRDYSKLHKRETQLLKSIADVVLRLRLCYENSDGRPDLTGESQQYREAAHRMYVSSGIPADSRRNTQSAVRYHVNTRLREYMREHGYTAEDYEYYGLDPKSKAERGLENSKARTRAARQHREAAAASETPVEAPGVVPGVTQPDLGELFSSGSVSDSPDPRGISSRIQGLLDEVADIAAAEGTESALSRLKAADRRKLRAALDAADETNVVLRSYL